MEILVCLLVLGVVRGRQQAISYQNFRASHGQGHPTYGSDGSWSQRFGGGQRGLSVLRGAFSGPQRFTAFPSSQSFLHQPTSFFSNTPQATHIHTSGPPPPHISSYQSSQINYEPQPIPGNQNLINSGSPQVYQAPTVSSYGADVTHSSLPPQSYGNDRLPQYDGVNQNYNDGIVSSPPAHIEPQNYPVNGPIETFESRGNDDYPRNDGSPTPIYNDFTESPRIESSPPTYSQDQSKPIYQNNYQSNGNSYINEGNNYNNYDEPKREYVPLNREPNIQQSPGPYNGPISDLRNNNEGQISDLRPHNEGPISDLRSNERPPTDLRTPSDRPLTELRGTGDRPLTDLRTHGDRAPTDLRTHGDRAPTDLRSHGDRPSTDLRSHDVRPTADLRTHDVRPTADLRTHDVRPTADLRNSDRPSTDLRIHSDRPLTDLKTHSDRPLSDLRTHGERPSTDLRSHNPTSDLRNHNDRPVSDFRNGNGRPGSDFRSHADRPLSELRNINERPHSEIRSNNDRRPTDFRYNNDRSAVSDFRQDTSRPHFGNTNSHSNFGSSNINKNAGPHGITNKQFKPLHTGPSPLNRPQNLASNGRTNPGPLNSNLGPPGLNQGPGGSKPFNRDDKSPVSKQGFGQKDSFNNDRNKSEFSEEDKSQSFESDFQSSEIGGQSFESDIPDFGSDESYFNSQEGYGSFESGGRGSFESSGEGKGSYERPGFNSNEQKDNNFKSDRASDFQSSLEVSRNSDDGPAEPRNNQKFKSEGEARHRIGEDKKIIEDKKSSFPVIGDKKPTGLRGDGGPEKGFPSARTASTAAPVKDTLPLANKKVPFVTPFKPSAYTGDKFTPFVPIDKPFPRGRGSYADESKLTFQIQAPDKTLLHEKLLSNSPKSIVKSVPVQNN